MPTIPTLPHVIARRLDIDPAVDWDRTASTDEVVYKLSSLLGIYRPFGVGRRSLGEVVELDLAGLIALQDAVQQEIVRITAVTTPSKEESS